MKSVLTVLAVLLLVPAAASAQRTDRSVTGGSLVAQRQDLRNPDQRAPYVVPVQVHGTNVAAPDQQSPKIAPAPAPIEVHGTNVAAPDQQSPKIAPAPVHVAAPAPGFDWGTAAIGAATSLLLMTALFGIAVTVRRRHSVIPG